MIFTSKTRILQGFAFLCKLGLFLNLNSGNEIKDSKFFTVKYKRQQVIKLMLTLKSDLSDTKISK